MSANKQKSGTCEHETRCWRCTRPGTGTCCWDKDLTPVPGWDAEMSQLEGCVSWHVYACPLFDEMKDFDDRERNSPSDEVVEVQSIPGRMAYLFQYGWTNKAIALEFGLSIVTVKKYRTKWRKNREAD